MSSKIARVVMVKVTIGKAIGNGKHAQLVMVVVLTILAIPTHTTTLVIPISIRLEQDTQTKMVVRQMLVGHMLGSIITLGRVLEPISRDVAHLAV